MTEEEWAAHADDFVKVISLKGDQELTRFLEKEQTKRDPYNSVQYRLWLVPDYSDTESAIIIKVHHCMADGLGFAAFMLAVSDNYDVKNLPHLKPLSPFRQTMIYLAAPFFYLP